MNNSWEIVRLKLLRLRETHGAVSDFSRHVGISRQSCENWLKGESVPGIDKLDAIAEALGTTPAELIKSPDGKPELSVEEKDRNSLLGALFKEALELNNHGIALVLEFLRVHSRISSKGIDKRKKSN